MECLVLLLCALGALASPASPSVKNAGAFDAVRQLETSTAMGVDRNGNLWSWNQVERSVSQVHPDGTRVQANVPGDARGIDADPEFGIILLGSNGKTARILDWNGKQTAEVVLPDEAGKICWLDDGEFAVGPLFTPYRVQIFSVRTGLMSGHFGPVPAIQPPRAGAVMARATLLRYDFQRRELVALDAYGGDLTVFSEKGDVVRHATVTHPDRASIESWLAQANESSKAKGESFAPTVWSYPTMALGADSTVWLAEKLVDDTHVTLVKIDRKGAVTRSTVTNDCASLRIQAWQGTLIFFRDPKTTRAKCIGLRRS